jgi:hypothetical protein
VAVVVILLVSWYLQGLIGAIGAEHWVAIRNAVMKYWSSDQVSDDFCLCVEVSSGQRVEAFFPQDRALFQEAWDALDAALMQLPETPESHLVIEWDASQRRWVQPL